MLSTCVANSAEISTLRLPVLFVIFVTFVIFANATRSGAFVVSGASPLRPW
jgi:hypothetical protein